MMRFTLLLGFLALSQAALINQLPGAPAVNFKQYAGYFGVGQNKNHQLHYWFIESQSNPATDPVLIWLTGGPGCSGLSAILTEWGPFLANDDGATLRLNPYSWNQKASILTLEAPAGVGYSYSTDGNVQTGDNQTASENWEALVAFFNTFPQYKNNDFYVTGESYGGIYVPTLVRTIMDRQNQFKMNLKGFAVGNGCVSFPENTDSLIEFMYGHGLIDDTKWKKVRSQCCNNDIDDCQFHNFSGLNFCNEFAQQETTLAWSSGLNPYNMYDNCVQSASSQPVPLRFAADYRQQTGKDVVTSQLSSVPCLNETAVTTYLNRQDVRKALGVPTSIGRWDICSNQISQTYTRETPDTSSIFVRAITSGIKVMLYSGDVDMACNFLMGQRFSRKLGFNVSKGKKHYNVGGQIGGYHTQYGLLHFVTVRGAGHMVPSDKPAVAYHILDSFINNKAF
ncbi:unnamed protein product [Auanema sp. JU1783]|nr:unnamed protein product [Auanema sp. JU1783]